MRLPKQWTKISTQCSLDLSRLSLQVSTSKTLDWTIWDKIKIEEPITLGGFIEKLKNEYNVTLNMLTYGEVTLFSDYFVDAAEAAKRMPMRIEDIYLKVMKKDDLEGLKMMILGIGGDLDGVDVVMPPVCYRFA